MTENAIKKNVWQMPGSSPYLQRGLVLDNSHLLVQVPRRSGILWKRIVHKEFGIISRTRCCWNSQKVDVQFSVQQLHCPGAISKAKDRENCQYTSLLIIQRLRPIFRIIVSANQLSLYGAVANMCEEFEFHQDRSGQPDVLMGQSIVLSEIKAEVPLENDIPSHQNLLLQQYQERIKLLSQESKVSKFCMDAGFEHVVEVGQYFMTKDTGDFTQFHAVACREYTLPRNDESSQPKGWIQGNTKIGPVLEVTTSYLWSKYGIEIRIWSLSQDNSHSWVRISHGTNKYVVDSNYNNTEVPADLPEEQASQSSVKVIAARSKSKAKPQKRESVELPSTIPMNERKWIDIEPAEPSLSAYEVSKKVVNLLRHNQTTQREDDGAVQFWRIKFHLQNQSPQVPYLSDDRWKACLAAGGGSKRRYQYCSDISGTIVYLRALQGHSGRNLINPSLQDNVIIQCGLFRPIYHIGCAFNLHSIINNGLISGGQDSSKRQTVFFLPIDPRDKEHQDPEHIDFSVPRRAQFLHSAWKKHQDAVFWVDINFAIQKGLTFCQTRSNAIILQGTLPAYCIPKVVRLKTGEVLYEKSYMSPRPPPKISLRNDHDWTRGNDELGSTVEQKPVGKLIRQSSGEVQRATFSQLTQPKPKPICDRSGKPDSTENVLLKVKRPFPTTSMKKVCTKNLVFQIDQGNLIICLKTPVLSKLTMDQGNLMSETAQVHTQ